MSSQFIHYYSYKLVNKSNVQFYSLFPSFGPFLCAMRKHAEIKMPYKKSKVSQFHIMFHLMSFAYQLHESHSQRGGMVKQGKIRIIINDQFQIVDPFIIALWARITKNTDCSTGPLAHLFARSLAPLTHFTHSLARGKVNDQITILSVFFFLFSTIVIW